MSRDDLKAYIHNLETEYADLQRQLAEAKDYIDRMEDTRL